VFPYFSESYLHFSADLVEVLKFLLSHKAPTEMLDTILIAIDDVRSFLDKRNVVYLATTEEILELAILESRSAQGGRLN
jgi:hypothetical protein